MASIYQFLMESFLAALGMRMTLCCGNFQRLHAVPQVLGPPWRSAIQGNQSD